MKRVDLIRPLEGAGCVLIRHGGNHDWYCNAKTGLSQPVPRHREIADTRSKATAQNYGSAISYGDVSRNAKNQALGVTVNPLFGKACTKASMQATVHGPH